MQQAVEQFAGNVATRLGRYLPDPFVIAILLTFSLAGMTVVRLKSPVLGLILPDGTPAWLRWPVYVVVIMPIYQVVLIVYGTLLWQFRFFWSKEKAIIRWIFRMGRGTKARPTS